MEKHKNKPPQQPAGSMLNQKTNEDFNKKKPSSTDPNEQEGHPDIVIPDFGDDEMLPITGGKTKDRSEQQKPPNKSEGSE